MRQVLLAAVVLASGCACPGDELRVVQPALWYELPLEQLMVECRDADPQLRGCVVSRYNGDHIYTLPVVRPAP